MSFTSLNLLLLLLFVFLFWRNSLNVRERAVKICQAACKSHDVQLLDQTVALRGMGLSWNRSGPGIRRTYSFEFTVAGDERLTGYLVMLGDHSLALRLDLPESGEPPDRLH